MAENKEQTKLFQEFPPISSEEWRAKIDADLKGADFERKLVWKSPEGFNVPPYYRAEDLDGLQHLGTLPGSFPFVRGNKVKGNDWKVRQDIKVADIEATNKKILDALMKGANAIGLVVQGDVLNNQNDFDKLMWEVAPEAIEINFVTASASADCLALLANSIEKRGLDKAAVTGSADFDPIRHLNVTGKFATSEDDAFNRLTKIVEFGKEHLPNYRVFSVNAQYFNNAGSSIVQELGLALAVGTEYVARLIDKGLSVNDIAPRIQFNFAVGSNYFMEIAKIRAARLLWARIIESFSPCCPEMGKMNIHSVTSRWNKTVYDPYVNMLRSTTEAMSASLGGTDSLTVEPFDAVFGESTNFSERISRNVQTLLKEESYFDKVADPAAGSYYIENLTDSIAAGAWALFQEVEEKGGYIAAFKAGAIQDKLKATAQKRDMNIATRRENLLGVNQFPNFSEVAGDAITESIVVPVQPVAAADALGEPLKLYRGAAAFEAVRLKTDQSGKKPKAWMFTYGSPAMRTARSQFARNFFACAGFDVIDNLGFATVEEGVAAAKAAKAEIVVVCSADDDYATIVPEIAAALSQAIVVVAGNPECKEELEAKGIKNFVHVRTNVLEALTYYQGLLGI